MAHYYDKIQTSALHERRIEYNGLHLLSASGLFSKDHVDNATKLLIEKSEIQGARSILDLGCGYGVVALSIKKKFPNSRVVASDNVDRAIIYTRKNAVKNKLDIFVVQSDVLSSVEETFDVILTNPPYVAGKKVTFAFIEQSFEKLNSGGSLQLVARHQKGGKSLGLHMEMIFGNCVHIAKSGGFRIYKSVKDEFSKGA